MESIRLGGTGVKHTNQYKINIDEKEKELLYEKLIEQNFKKFEKQIHKWNTEKRKGLVYMVSSPTFPKWIKIGITTNLKSRLHSFNAANPNRDFVLDCTVEAEHIYKAESLLLLDIDNATGTECHSEWIKIKNKSLAKKIFTNYKEKDISLITYLDVLKHKHYRYPQMSSSLTSETVLNAIQEYRKNNDETK